MDSVNSLGLEEEEKRRIDTISQTTHVRMVTNLRFRSAVAVLIVDVIDLLLLSFVPRVVLLNR